LQIGHLDPVEETTGIQGRLNNLGFDCGEVDGIIGPQTEAAVRAFQDEHSLEADGIPGPKTQAKLKEVHGC
jgi:N-acetylmuramoyl-L-alanine amidase